VIFIQEAQRRAPCGNMCLSLEPHKTKATEVLQTDLPNPWCLAFVNEK